MKATVQYKAGGTSCLGEISSLKMDEKDDNNLIHIVDAEGFNIEIDRKLIKSIEIN